MIGLETEYLFHDNALGPGRPLSREHLDKLLLTEHLLISSTLNNDDHRLWLVNGGMMYVDGDFFEYATP